jgi:hypothetical protein
MMRTCHFEISESRRRHSSVDLGEDLALMACMEGETGRREEEEERGGERREEKGERRRKRREEEERGGGGGGGA